MRTVSVDEVGSTLPDDQADVRPLSDPLGTADVAINRFRLEPDERFSGSLHAHEDQEEVFVVVEGEATFETYLPDGGTDRQSGDGAGEFGEVTVGAGEVIRFAPGEFQSGRNESGDDVVAYALGAPRDSEAVRVPLSCSACGHGAVRPTIRDDDQVLVCPDCGAESAVACEACGSDQKAVRLADSGDGLVDVCGDCGNVTDV